jgi:hypothetical protein
LLIKKRGKVILTLCKDCDRSKTQIPVALEDTDKYSAVERINIETHPALKKFKLERVRGAWRKAFKSKYEIKSSKRGSSSSGNKCWHKWTIRARAGGKELSSREAKHCLEAKGAYLHPSRSFALVKESSEEWTTDEVGTSSLESVHYRLVELAGSAGTPRAQP